MKMLEDKPDTERAYEVLMGHPGASVAFLLILEALEKDNIESIKRASDLETAFRHQGALNLIDRMKKNAKKKKTGQ